MRLEEVLIMDRLKTLIFSFYREEFTVQASLAPLVATKMTRVMGTICIECLDFRHLELVLPLAKYLQEPIALLQLSRNIIFYSSDFPDCKYSIEIQTDKNLYV